MMIYRFLETQMGQDHPLISCAPILTTQKLWFLTSKTRINFLQNHLLQIQIISNILYDYQLTYIGGKKANLKFQCPLMPGNVRVHCLDTPNERGDTGMGFTTQWIKGFKKKYSHSGSMKSCTTQRLHLSSPLSPTSDVFMCPFWPSSF